MPNSRWINLDRYPINKAGPALDAAIEAAREALAQDGCAVLSEFLTPEGVAALAEEADAVAPKAHRTFNRTNAYFTKDDPTLPEDHPKRRFFDRSNAFVPADNFAAHGPLRNVQNAPGFDAFIQACLQETTFHRYADPLADVIVNTAGEGPGFPWHFDTNNFTVTLAIQNAEEGGAFEYAPAIRDGGGNENFEEVARVLDGTSDRIVRLDLLKDQIIAF